MRQVSFPKPCRRIAAGQLDPRTIHTHTWEGLDSLPQALADQEAGAVLKGMVRVGATA